MSEPSQPGWYPDPSGKKGKLFWDGSEWFTAVPASRQHGSPKLFKTVGIVAGVATMAGVAIAIALTALSDGGKDQGATATSAPGVPPPPSTPRQMSLKTMPTDGVYRVGGDQVDPGVWESLGPADAFAKPCAWARLSAPQETPDHTIEAGASKSGPTRVRIRPTDAAFSTHGCQPWHMVEP